MSKVLKAILPAIGSVLLILQFFNNASGQRISATVILDPTLRTARIAGKFEDPSDSRGRNLSFIKQLAGIDSLGTRVTGLLLSDRDGVGVGYRQLIPGEFLADGPFVNWRYQVDLAPRPDAAASAHISWLSDGIGIIYLDDLMPQLPTKNQHTLANISLELPNGWQVSATEKRTSEFVFKSINVETSVLLIGQNLRGRTIISGSHSIGLVIGGRWQFSDDEAAKIAKEIYDDYRDLFGADASGQAQIALLKFPVPASTGQWEASTIGSSVTILSEDMPFKTQSLQRLHEQLRHEIFHLWIPNGINLKGNYDWFYEGFALYASLKNGVRLNRIGFEDFLDTLSRARTIDSFQNPRLSLIDASQNRWSGGNTTVYSRGMIVAFLCDLALLNNSKGKTNVSDLLKEIFEKYQYETGSIDGTETVLRALDAHTELQPIVEKYIKGKSVIDWDVDVSAAGIVSEEKNSVTVLKPTEKPNARQKVLLDRLGYNSWRRIGTK